MPLADELNDDDDIFASSDEVQAVEEGIRVVPHNIDVEQALLGTILVNNAALQYVDDRLQPDHFYEPIHRLIFSTIKTFYDRGNISSYTTLKHYFSTMGEVHLPSPNYLEELAIAAAIVIDVREHSEIL